MTNIKLPLRFETKLSENQFLDGVIKLTLSQFGDIYKDNKLYPLLCQLRGKKIQPLRNQMHRIGPQDQQLRIRRPQMKPRLRHHRQRPIPVIGIIVPFNICIIEGEIIHSA